MAEVLLTSPELVVFGGPSDVEVQVDFGPKGSRGSKFFAGEGEPSTAPGGTLEGQDIEVNDLYINTSLVSANYGWLYQYALELSTPAWIKILKINSSNYHIKESLSFNSSGEASKEIFISAITDEESPLLADFVTNVNVESVYPIAFGITQSITGAGVNKKLKIDIKALSYQALAWGNLTGSNTVDISVAYKA